MTQAWSLPVSTVIGGKTYAFHGDFRDILEIFSYLDDPDLPEFIRWRVALGLFYEEEIPAEHAREAMDYLCRFINCGKQSTGKPAPRLLDWEQDSGVIAADVNKAAGQEIRALPFVHWWTFMAWFNAIGQGQLSTIVSIRDKLRRGKPLEKWEQAYYRENRQQVDLKKKYSAGELAERERLNKLLEGA